MFIDASGLTGFADNASACSDSDRAASSSPRLRAVQAGSHRVLQRLKTKQTPRGQEVPEGSRARGELRGC